MARQLNPDRKTTPISIEKTQKLRLRKYAEPSKTRKGNESDSQILERILKFYEEKNPVQTAPKPTYIPKP